MKVLSVGWNTFNETGKYTCATVEYASLVSYSMLKRGGMVVMAGIQIITSPVTAAVRRPFVFVKNGASRVFSNKEYEEKLKGLEEKLRVMEERLAEIEKHGVVPASRAAASKKEKRLSEDKRLVLHGILEDTKSLREM
jgi:hypothetical protein